MYLSSTQVHIGAYLADHANSAAALSQAQYERHEIGMHEKRRGAHVC